jgi:rod shape-determining protein MreD
VNLGRGLWIAGWVVLLVVLHYALRPLLAWRVQADFLVIALLVIAVRTRPALAAFLGFVFGMLTDALAPESFGAGALALAMVGFASSWLKAAFFTENLLLNGVFVFLGKWAFDLIYMVAAHKMHFMDIVVQLLLWSPLAAVFTAVVGLVVLAISQPPEMGRRR